MVKYIKWNSYGETGIVDEINNDNEVVVYY